jgi:hypothetical protein
MLYNQTGSHMSSVLVAGGEKHVVQCEGKLWLDTDTGPIILTGVLVVPTFEVNLCSEGRLADKGLYIVKTDTTTTICDMTTREEVISGSRKRDLYKLNCTIRRQKQSAAFAATATKAFNVQLFHRLLGHPSMQATSKLLLGNAVIGVKHSAVTHQDPYTATCLICQKGKATRASFPKSNTRATTPCALVHSDLIGPCKQLQSNCSEKSTGAAMYVLTFVDDISRYGEAIPIKRKTDVYD